MTDIIGWRRWGYGKYHAILRDSPKNHVVTNIFGSTLVAWSACDQYGAYVVDGGFIDDPKEEHKCKNCMKKMMVVDKQ